MSFIEEVIENLTNSIQVAEVSQHIDYLFEREELERASSFL